VTVTAITLTDPVSGLSLPIMPADGVAAQILDVAAPARAVTEDRVAAHGTYDTTRYLADAAVSLSLLLFAGVTQTPELFLDSLGLLLRPAARPYLIVTNDQWAQQRQLTVRYSTISKPLSDPTNWPVQIQWVAPNGAWEAAALQASVINAFQPTSVGISFNPVTGLSVTSAGYVFPATTAPPPNLVISPGTTQSQWTASLYGPCTGPVFTNVTTGQSLIFSGALSLAAGQFVALDSQAQTAFLNNDPKAPVLSFLDFANPQFQWWQIQPGVNTVSYAPGTTGTGSLATLSFRPAWIP
jgi:hypothetical protein